MEKKRVKALTGVYEGFVDGNGVVNFLGIPYVKKPERWKRAEPLEPSDELIMADTYGPACWQDWLPEEFDEEPAMSEDCLHLNIWTADLEQTDKPVMIWIHGGANATGSNGFDCCHGVYCGDLFVRDNPDIVYVNINYRLNIFGSMDFSTIDKDNVYKDSNNLQLLDQMAAIKWVYENIAAFGGDPENITLFGQSAGAYSISTLLLIPEAVRYFKKAICESCSVDETLKTKEQAVYIGEQFLELTGAKTMEECLALTPQEIIRVVGIIMRNPICPAYCGARDGVLLPEDIYGMLESGNAGHVTLLCGTTSGEYDTMSDYLSDEEILERVRDSYPGKITDEMVEQYVANEPDRDCTTALKDMFNDSMRLTVVKLSECMIKGGSDVYMYYINCMDEADTIRPQHCYEIPYLSGRLDAEMYMSNEVAEPVQGRTPSDERRRRFQSCWAAFARTGNPNPGDGQLPDKWEKYTPEGRETMVIGREWLMAKGIRNKDTDLLMEAATQK